MTDTTQDDQFARRHLIRGGAVLAGAAGLTAIGAAMAPKASAVDGQPINQGQVSSGTTTTTVAVSGGATATTAALKLTNNGGGPTLELTPVSNDVVPTIPDLTAGQIVTTIYGPYIGVSDGTDSGTTFLATQFDLEDRATPVPREIPTRVLITSTVAGRQQIVATAPDAFDASFRVKAGKWIEVAVDQLDLDKGFLEGVFVNLTVTSSLAAGYLTIYPGPTLPATSSLNFAAGQTIANSAFVGVRFIPSTGIYVLRIYARQTTHILLDVTGDSLKGPTALPLAGGGRSTARRMSAARRRVRVQRRKK